MYMEIYEEKKKREMLLFVIVDFVCSENRT